MSTAPVLLHLALALSLVLPTACSTSRARIPKDDGQQQVHAPAERARAPASEPTWVEPLPVRLATLPGSRLRLSFPTAPPHPDLERLHVEDVRPLLTAFASFRPPVRPRLRLMLETPGLSGSSQGSAPAWESRLRGEFLSQYGPALLPLPESLETSRLYAALKLSTHYMDEGIREAAQELFNSPAFLASVSLSVLVYFAAWLAPEPLFSKAFAAALTVRLSLLVGLVELGRLARACLHLHQEAEAATTPQQLEAAAERFGKSLGGTTLRVLVVVASLGVPQVLPKVPEGGLWTLLSPLRHAPAGGPVLESIASVQIVADGTLVIAGVAAGTSTTSVCGELAACAMLNGTGGPPGLSTRYGKPHTRENPPHNEAIENELSAREAAGHLLPRKNKPQLNAEGRRVHDPNPVKGIRYRKPDASSVRPDGVRHNTNYVSNPRDVSREVEAFEAMVRADLEAIHELYLLNGTLLRRYVPPGVSFP
jgi:hypothetical protein